MSRGDTALVVGQDTRLVMTLVRLLRESGCEAAVTTSYTSGRNALDSHPAVVIAELKLGAYNGLHLALRARVREIGAVVCDEGNPATEREAREIGAAYLNVQNLERTAVQAAVGAALMQSRRDVRAASTPAMATSGSAGTVRGTGISVESSETSCNPPAAC
jgi:DNA-binding response OmpR family regulator